MAGPRPTWKGALQISLVTIPIKVYPATEASESLSFNQLHAECKTRINQRKWCQQCAREVPSAEIVKGYEFEKNRYVILSDEDFEKVSPESTRVIHLVQFAPAAALDPIHINRTFYLAPDGPLALEGYAVMRDAMRGTIGIGKVALYGREYLVAVRPSPDGLLLLHTLHHAAEIRSADGIEGLHNFAMVPRATMTAAKQVIAAFTKSLNLAEFTDEYKAGLQAIIDAKIAGNEIAAPTIDRTPAIANLTEALTKSLRAAQRTKPLRMAKVTTGKRSRAK